MGNADNFSNLETKYSPNSLQTKWNNSNLDLKCGYWQCKWTIVRKKKQVLIDLAGLSISYGYLPRNAENKGSHIDNAGVRL